MKLYTINNQSIVVQEQPFSSLPHNTHTHAHMIDSHAIHTQLVQAQPTVSAGW